MLHLSHSCLESQCNKKGRTSISPNSAMALLKAIPLRLYPDTGHMVSVPCCHNAPKWGHLPEIWATSKSEYTDIYSRYTPPEHGRVISNSSVDAPRGTGRREGVSCVAVELPAIPYPSRAMCHGSLCLSGEHACSGSVSQCWSVKNTERSSRLKSDERMQDYFNCW